MRTFGCGLVARAVMAAALAVGVVGFLGCTGTNPRGTGARVVAADALYNRLGGDAGITKLVDRWIDKAVADKRVNTRFSQAHLPEMKSAMATQLCQAAGGPQTYLGKDMKTAHKGMNISDAEWKAFMDDLKDSLDELKVGAMEREELLVILNPMRRDVVGQ